MATPLPRLERVSVIIPALNEESAIGDAVRGALAAGADEVIVADGGSRDATRARAAAGGARVIAGPKGRGPQLNAGAAEASGTIFWFLHADARPRPDAGALLRAALAEPGAAGGHFRVTFGNSAHARWLAAFYDVLQRFRVVYGDAAIFCRREAFVAAGGFPPYPIMEDLAFMQTLRRRGRVVALRQRVHASPRRWEHGGIAQAWAAWLVIQSLYFLRVPPAKLAPLYRQIR